MDTQPTQFHTEENNLTADIIADVRGSFNYIGHHENQDTLRGRDKWG